MDELKIGKGEHYYIYYTKNGIRLRDINDAAIAKRLEISDEQYTDILKKYGAKKFSICINYYFENINEAENALEELNTILMMNKLIL